VIKPLDFQSEAEAFRLSFRANILNQQLALLPSNYSTDFSPDPYPFNPTLEQCQRTGLQAASIATEVFFWAGNQSNLEPALSVRT